MIVLGLTGSIGMGKSTAAKMLQEMGIPVHDSDATVHALLGAGGAAVPAVKALVPEAAARDEQGREFIDRKKLGARFFDDPAVKKQVEDILFPLVRQSSDTFVADKKREGYNAVVLDIPLLYETGGEARVDKVIVVTAAPEVQRARVLARGTSPERLQQVLDAQLPDAEKRKRADFVVETDKGLEDTRQQLKTIVDRLSPPPKSKPKFCL